MKAKRMCAKHSVFAWVVVACNVMTFGVVRV